MASGEASTSQPGKVSTSQPGKVSTSQPGKTLSTSGLPMEGCLDINTDCQSGTDKWNTTNLQRRYCKLQRSGDSLSLEVYSDEKITKLINTLSLFKTPSKDTARNAAKLCRGQLVTEDDRVLCVMADDERVSEWADSLNSVIKPVTSDTDGNMKTEGDGVRHTADSTTHPAGTSDGEDHVPRQLSEEPEVIKTGWLNILTDPAPGEDKWDKVQTGYCMLQRQGDSYRLEVYKTERDWRCYDEDSDIDCDSDSDSDSLTYWTGNVATVCLDTARHVQLWSRCKVATMDDKVLCVMRETDDVMSRWIVSLNRAIMAARCQDTRQTATDSSDRADTEDRQGGVPPSEPQVEAVSHAESEFLNAWFPGFDKQSYIIPVVHYETVHGYDDYNVGGHNVTVLQTDRERKIQHCIKNEKARVAKSVANVLKRVHASMTSIKDKVACSERFVIMTEVKCALYNSLYAGAAERINKTHSNTQSNPESNPESNTHSSQASEVEWDMKDGLTDLLVIHPDHGLLLGAVTRNTGSDPNALRKDLRKAVAYLHRAEVVVKDVILAGVSGKSAVTINKTILLPNLTRQNLKDTLRHQPQVRERLKRCVGVQPGHDVTRLCLTKDDMADEQRLEEWWTACLKHDTQDDTARMGDEVYRALVARFAVPLTTVEMSLSTQPRLQLWTEGHVVHAVGEEHGRDLTRIALFPRQVELLEDTPDDDDDDDDVRILHGGPGTAKTILLLLRGVSWFRDGCDTVFNIQTERDGQAAAYLVSHQLRETVARARQGDTVARPDFTVQQDNMRPWWDWENTDWTKKGRLAVAAWCDARSEDRKVHIIADEANGHIISHLYRELKGRGCTVKLWAAGVDLQIPRNMRCYVRKITAPLRCPPCVVREVEQARDMNHGPVPRYTKPPVAPPCDGPPVIPITHYRKYYSGDREGHQAEGRDGPVRCEECGRRVAHTLLHTLHLGRRDNGPGEQGGLRYNDVFIMGDGIDCAPDTPDDYSNPPAPFIRGLRQLGIPARVVHPWDSEAVRRVAENSWTGVAVADAVTIVDERTVWGLERKVVVFLDRGLYDVGADMTGRLLCMSRSTSQVVWVKLKP